MASIATAAAVAGVACFGYAADAQAGRDDGRYPAKPWGWDGPAGKCVVCHSLERGGPARVAPNLWGVVGAPKGRAKGYGYSLALAKAGGVWTEKDLDQYLAAPSRFLPGTNKTIAGLPNAEERAKLINFLATLKD
jgi:cytochrome c2